jgi:hypothetical protein
MSKKFYPVDLLNQAQSIRNAWSEIDNELAFGDLTTSSMGAEIEQARLLDEELDRLETILVNKRNQRDTCYANVWEAMKRAKTAIKGIYGDDSTQYEMVGGTRLSERKSPTRKAAAG